MAVTPMLTKELLRAAKRARKQSYSPYSKYKVGAAVLASDGRIFSGANVENASYGLTVCAERVAIFKGVSEGLREIKAVAIVAGGSKKAYPCGACRQVILEFGKSSVVIVEHKGKSQKTLLKALLPHAFEFSRKMRR